MKNASKSRESSWRAEDTARGSSRQGQRNTRSTPQLWRTGETNDLRDRVETGGSGGPLNDFEVVEENELEAERKAHLEASVVCDLQTACFLSCRICGLTSWRDPLKSELTGAVLTPPVSAEIYWQFGAC